MAKDHLRGRLCLASLWLGSQSSIVRPSLVVLPGLDTVTAGSIMGPCAGGQEEVAVFRNGRVSDALCTEAC